MADRPFPDDPNAETCVHTGARAYAAAGRYGRNRVTGWYGSAVVDLDDVLLVLDPEFPEGAVCDAVLRDAVADGRLYDPSALLAGEVRLSELPDAVIAGMVGLGVDMAHRHLSDSHGVPDGLSVPPVHDVERDDPLSLALMRCIMGVPRHRGPDLEQAGVLMALLHKARNRPLAGEARGAALAGFVARVRENEEMGKAILAGLRDAGEPEAQESGQRSRQTAPVAG